MSVGAVTQLVILALFNLTYFDVIPFLDRSQLRNRSHIQCKGYDTRRHVSQAFLQSRKKGRILGKGGADRCHGPGSLP